MTAWLIAFLLHSTLWCILAWLIVRIRPGVSARMRELIWTTAIAASFISPAVQTLVSPDSVLWHVHVPEVVASADVEHSVAPVAPANWHGPVTYAWLAIALGLLLLQVGRLVVLRTRLGFREIVDNPHTTSVLEDLSSKAGLHDAPRLTEDDSLGSPIAFGFGKSREICVPTRALHELDDAELTALLGHELAHHIRRDGLRLGVLNVLQAVFFFQPFLRVAARDLHFAAEERCDDWSASQLEDRYAMASCLTEVATWLVRRDRTIPVPCMARRRSQLAVRVRRLVDDDARSDRPSSMWARLASVAFVAITPWIAPSVASTGEASHARPTEVSREHGEHSRGDHGSREHR